MANRGYVIRLVEPRDDAMVHHIIVQTLTELGLAHAGTAAGDPEIASMSHWMAQGRHRRYWVAESAESGQIWGGGGVMPLKGLSAESGVCEVMKFYLRGEARGLGIGRSLLSLALTEAATLGFTQAYAETCNQLQSIPMLTRAGFVESFQRQGDTGHLLLDRFFTRTLSDLSQLGHWSLAS